MTLLMQANHMFASCIGAGVLCRLTLLFSVLLYSQTIHAEVIGKPFVQLGHVSGAINSVAFSPNGRYFLSASDDRSVKLWDVNSGKVIRTYFGHDEAVHSVVFSPDGRLFLSGSEISMKIRDVTTGKILHEFPGVFIQAIFFSPDGQYLLSGAGGETISVSQWDAASGKEIVTVSGHSKFSRPLVFSPDGQYVISAPDPRLYSEYDQSGRILSSDAATMALVEVSSGREIRIFAGHTDYIRSAAFSPDGRLLASSGNDMTLKLWDVATGDEIREYSDQSTLADAMDYAHDLLAVELERELGNSVWGMEEEIRNKHSAYAVAFSSDGQRLISGRKNRLRLWDVSTGKMIREFTVHSDQISAFGFSPDGRFILASGDSGLKLWKVANGKEVEEYSGDSDWITSLSFSPDGSRLVSGSSDSSIRLWDLSTSTMAQRYTGHSDSVISVAISPDGNAVLSGSSDMSMRLWEIATGEQMRQFSVSGHAVSSAAFSPDGKSALSSAGTFFSIWDIPSGKEIRQYSSHPYLVRSAAFSSDGKYLISRHYDKSLRLWSLSSGKEMRKFTGHTGSVNFTFSPDGRYLIQTDQNFSGEKMEQEMSLLDFSTGDEILKFPGSALDTPIAFSPDGLQLLSAHDDGLSMKLWDVSSGEMRGGFSDQSRVGHSVVFSPNGLLIASAYSDGSFKLFDAERFEELASFYGFSDGEWIVITPDGYFNTSPYGAEHLNVLTGSMRVAGIGHRAIALKSSPSKQL